MKIQPTAPEKRLSTNLFDVEKFQDFVCSHGFGEATEEGIQFGAHLLAIGDDVATAAAEIVSRGFTVDAE